MSKKGGYIPGIGIAEIEEKGSEYDVKGFGEEGQFASDLSRSLGLAGKIARNQKIIQGLTNPQEYLEKKNAAIKKLENELNKEYTIKYYRLVQNGVPVEKAISLARKSIETKKNVRMAQIELDFPTDVEKLAYKKLKGGKGDNGKGEKDTF